jgi:hypothetical protein
MSENVVTTIISAAATICAAWGAAWINARRLQRRFEMAKEEGHRKERRMRILSIATSRWFVWIVAPLTGALLWYGGVRVQAGALPLKAPCCIANNFYPSGWMGDGADKSGTKYIQLNDQWKDGCHMAPCIRVSYEPGPIGWAGVYWQYPDGNWGGKPGRELKGVTKLEFWAKGEKGGEVVSFKVGGINSLQYHDSLEKSLGPVILTTEWQKYEFDLGDADTSSVIGAFAWIVNRDGNPNGLTFYLDDICFK